MVSASSLAAPPPTSTHVAEDESPSERLTNTAVVGMSLRRIPGAARGGGAIHDYVGEIDKARLRRHIGATPGVSGGSDIHDYEGEINNHDYGDI